MHLIQLIETAGEAWSRWAGEHPIRAVLAVAGVIIGSTVTVKRLELPIYKWARDWLNTRLDGLGRRLNATVEAKLEAQSTEIATLRTEVHELRKVQQEQEATADRRRADDYRREILRFNRDLMEGAAPDRESYVEALLIIDRYELYCQSHPEYPNSRATAAVQNIKTNYQHRLTVGFCQEGNSWITS